LQLRAKQQRKMFPPTSGPRATPSAALTIQCPDVFQKGCPQVPEHSLGHDYASQCTLNFYEGELGDNKQPLLSPCSSGVGDVSSPSADSGTFSSFDLNPLFEQSSDLWHLMSFLGENEDSPLQEIDSLKPSITDLELDASNTLFNVEDVLLDKKDILKGPTLAALNSQDLDDLRWEGYSRPPLIQQKASNAPATLSTPPTSLPPSQQVCSPTMASPPIMIQHTQPEQAAMLPPTSAVQYVTFHGGKSVAQPFPVAPPMAPSSAQIIASNPCINQLLIPIKTEPVEPAPQQPSIAPAVAVKGNVENPVVVGIKRSLSPNADSNSSIEAKWNAIKDLLDDRSDLVPAKKIKSEPGENSEGAWYEEDMLSIFPTVDFAYNPQEETSTGSHTVENEVFDSGGEDDNSDRDSDNDDLSDVGK
jgi:hypothetical protein